MSTPSMASSSKKKARSTSTVVSYELSALSLSLLAAGASGTLFASSSKERKGSNVDLGGIRFRTVSPMRYDYDALYYDFAEANDAFERRNRVSGFLNRTCERKTRTKRGPSISFIHFNDDDFFVACVVVHTTKKRHHDQKIFHISGSSC